MTAEIITLSGQLWRGRSPNRKPRARPPVPLPVAATTAIRLINVAVNDLGARTRTSRQLSCSALPSPSWNARSTAAETATRNLRENLMLALGPSFTDMVLAPS
jgi:hypothetical protein